ncbi:MAG: hypothetical protein MI757_07175 [Pirellulales bacterium]|nr:hypothetical protein [Pirellulales bacterium]
MPKDFSNSDLEAYLDETLPQAQLSELEKALRADESLLEQLAAINARRDGGGHSLATIWRRHRVSCPTRQELANYLLGVLPPEQHDYVTFHVETIGCRFCHANLEDLRQRESEASTEVTQRRQKYFESSAGHLRRK